MRVTCRCARRRRLPRGHCWAAEQTRGAAFPERGRGWAKLKELSGARQGAFRGTAYPRTRRSQEERLRSTTMTGRQTMEMAKTALALALVLALPIAQAQTVVTPPSAPHEQPSGANSYAQH